MAELPTLGDHCSVETCKQIDFLPFICDSCRKTFCSHHRTPDKHNCDRSYEINRDGSSSNQFNLIYYPCTYDNCKNKELVPMKCSFCDKNFCMNHRISEDHGCRKLSQPSANMKLVNEPNKLPEPPKSRGRKSEKTAMKVAIMKLKMKAVGDNSIPQVDRRYFQVILPDSKAQPYFFSKDWTVGKVIDYIAEKEKIPNYNNVSTAKKLQLFIVEDDFVLPFNQTLSSLLDDRLQDGAELRLH